ncbi:adrenodoxin-like [Equus asinus]|uniref:adrenodoxin-like n=1 Tax=Equus asinus TaxID=9793 RepID=UPI0038F633FD
MRIEIQTRPAIAAVGTPGSCKARRGLLLAGPDAGTGGLPRARGQVAAREIRTLSIAARTRGSSEDEVTVPFRKRGSETLTAKGKVGDSLLDVVTENNLDTDGVGACEGTSARSTCHLIFEARIFEKLEAITDEESDMLDLAYGRTDRSPLGCQVCLTKSIEDDCSST